MKRPRWEGIRWFGWCLALAPLAALLALGITAGCNSPLVRSQSPDLEEIVEEPEEESTRLIGDLAVPLAQYVKVESVALVTGLHRTGSDPPPSSQRAVLIGEMQSHEVPNPNQVLASPDTSLVIVRGYLPPGVQKGDRFDVEVMIPTRSESTSLRDGWLLQTRMREMRVLDDSIHTGHVIALAGGPILVDAVFQGDADEMLEKRGRVLSGGQANQSRPMGLIVRSQYSSVRTSAAIGGAINRRFHHFKYSIKRGVATPKDDNYIELAVPKCYRHNLGRYIRVVRSIALGESDTERAERLRLLERMLADPLSASKAAVQLEALGRDGVDILKTGLHSSDAEVRFYAAEALAYMDEAEAAMPLAEAAGERAFRWHALAALSAMDHLDALDALADLIDAPSAETRVGAFRALRVRNSDDERWNGEVLGDGFYYHVIPAAGDPMIHLSTSRRAEVLLFGNEHRLVAPTFLFAGKHIMAKADGPGQMKISRFKPGEEDQHETCSNSLDDVIRTMARMGASYSDVVQAILQAKDSNCLESRLVVNALPSPGRSYRRGVSEEEYANGDDKAATPMPSLFSSRVSLFGGGADERRDESSDSSDAEEEESGDGFFGRMGRWFSE